MVLDQLDLADISGQLQAKSRLRKITDLAFQDVFYVQVIGF